MFDKLDELDNDTLYRYYANASATYFGALGHSKTHYNRVYVKKYYDELKLRKEEVPPMNVAHKFGVFNGEGSY